MTSHPHRVFEGAQGFAPAALDWDPETLTLADVELRQALSDYLQRGGELLDLRAHGEALGHGADELMECFGDACRRAQRRPRVLQLPADLVALPDWVGAFPSVSHLTAPGLTQPARVALAA